MDIEAKKNPYKSHCKTFNYGINNVSKQLK